jgi:hypothetical protein
LTDTIGSDGQSASDNRTMKIVDVRRLPGSRETTVYRGGGLFPVLTPAADGTIVAAVRGGAGHLGLAGRVEVVRSIDGGLSWSPPAVVADSDRDDRNFALGTSSDGTLVMAYHRNGCYDDEGSFSPDRFGGQYGEKFEMMTTMSHDGGLSWQQPSPLIVPPLVYGSPFGKIVETTDGTLLLPIYVSRFGAVPAEAHDESWTVRSVDGGRSWSDPTLIAERYNETGFLALPNGGVLAVLRGESGNDALSVSRSSDGGRTWTTPEPLTGLRQHPADLVTLADGSILVTYGNRNPPYRIEGRVSRDGGSTWLDALLLFSSNLYGYNVTEPRPTDMGYPSSALSAGQGVTMYYYNPSLQLEGNARRDRRSPFYDRTDYLAVAISWNERALLAALTSAGDSLTAS